MSLNIPALLGGAAGAVVFVLSVSLLVFCLCRNRNISRTSETGSSDPSLQGRNIGVELSSRGGSLPSDSGEARCFILDELVLATKNFSDINLIGEGKFGEVYKGLLQDGMVVAIKRRVGAPSRGFIIEVRYLASIQHRNLVNLLGYCQENGQQMLIFEYIPNGSISSHLYGVGQISSEKLEFKNRLSIALGAAKGLAHLHSMRPPMVHKNFKTANVLVDENFIAKVADAGIRNFLGRADASSSSQTPFDDVFLAPEVKEFGRFSDKSDVYSFGVFLLELVSGREATQSGSSTTTKSLVEWAQSYQESDNIYGIIDPRLRNSFTSESMKEFMELIIRCVDLSSQRRPNMEHVVSEIDKILENEVRLTTVMGEGTPTVTLGSQLFR
ncbi:hypothetical protein ACHQM5_011557 [Ranunculus cassubicifolius]